MSRVAFHDHPTNDAWCATTGPIFVKNATRTGEIAITDWAYNAWGDKYPALRPRTTQIPPRIAKALRLRASSNDMILEGGSIDVNGEGLLLTSEQCLLNKNAIRGATRAEMEQT